MSGRKVGRELGDIIHGGEWRKPWQNTASLRVRGRCMFDRYSYRQDVLDICLNCQRTECRSGYCVKLKRMGITRGDSGRVFDWGTVPEGFAAEFETKSIPKLARFYGVPTSVVTKWRDALGLVSKRGKRPERKKGGGA